MPEGKFGVSQLKDVLMDATLECKEVEQIYAEDEGIEYGDALASFEMELSDRRRVITVKIREVNIHEQDIEDDA